MNYEKLLKQKRPCPFCFYKEGEVVIRNKYAVLMVCLAPYTKDHLLIFTKRHVENFLPISAIEMNAVYALQRKAFRLLGRLGYKDMSILVREGKGSGKSISHIHWHVIPKIKVDGKHKGSKRAVLTPKQVALAVRRIREGK